MRKYTILSIVIYVSSISLLTACSTLLNATNAQSINEYPVAEILVNKYKTGWTTHLMLQNPQYFENPTLQFSYHVEPLDLSHLNIVNFYGQQAIELTGSKQVVAMLEEQMIFYRKIAYYIHPETFRYLGDSDGLEDNNQLPLASNKVTKTYPIPNFAKLNTKGLMSEGVQISSSFGKPFRQEATFKSYWRLTKADSQYAKNRDAKLCVITEFTILNDHSMTTMSECYQVNKQGNIVNREDSLTIDSPHYDMPKIYQMSKL